MLKVSQLMVNDLTDLPTGSGTQVVGFITSESMILQDLDQYTLRVASVLWHGP